MIRRQDEYALGDIVSIETPIGPVMHRIVGGDGDEGFVSQGDNNEISDPWRPATSDIVGKLWLRFPGGAHSAGPPGSPSASASPPSARWPGTSGPSAEKRWPPSRPPSRRPPSADARA